MIEPISTGTNENLTNQNLEALPAVTKSAAAKNKPISAVYCPIRLIGIATLAIAEISVRTSGGADRDRTGGLLVANQALSQLSYSPLNRLLAFSRQLSAKQNR